MSRQKGKGMKRLSQWHRGKAAGRVALRKLQRLPVVDPTVDYTAAEPKPFKSNHPPKGDAL